MADAVDSFEPSRTLDFDLLYDGLALVTNEMDVRDLGPALVGVGDLFRTLNRQIHPADPEVEVRVRATGEGSFVVELKLIYDAYANVVGNPTLNGTEGLAGLMAVAAGLIRYLRKRNKSGAHQSSSAVRPGFVRLTWPDGSTLEVPDDSIRLADQAPIRRPLANIVRPLAKIGVDTLQIRRAKAVLAEVEKEDLGGFGPPNDEQILQTQDRDVALRILNPALQVGRKWRVTDGRWPFWAEILDDNFNARIAAGERFGSQDTLFCKLRETQWLEDGRLHNRIEILEVLSHQTPPAQGTLDVA